MFVWLRFTGHDAESGAAMEMELAHLATFEGGKLRRVQECSDRAEAVAAVRLAAEALVDLGLAPDDSLESWSPRIAGQNRRADGIRQR
jgi:hypothetical protein